MFLQSLYEEELENLRLSKGISNGKNDNPREIQNQDIVDCLESDVQYWTDFSKVHYHPQSLYELNGLWMNNVEFDNYGIGRDIFSGGLRGEEISERLRFFIEECDHIQVNFLARSFDLYYVLQFHLNLKVFFVFLTLFLKKKWF